MVLITLVTFYTTQNGTHEVQNMERIMDTKLNYSHLFQNKKGYVPILTPFFGPKPF